MSNNRKKWICWIACVLVLAGAAAAVILFLPEKEVIPASNSGDSVRISGLSEDGCVAFYIF